MTLDEFIELEINPAKAFILGMIFPLYTEKTAKNGKRYILGQVRHNAKHISEDDLLEHHKLIKRFLKEFEIAEKIQVVANQTEEFGNLSGPLRGFTLLIEKEEKESESSSFERIFNLVKEIDNENDELKKYFVKGVFDGRSSMDTNSHLIVVDYNLEGEAAEIFSSIVSSLGFDLVPNKRHEGEGRNAQFRIKTSGLSKFNNEIGFFSVRRQKYLNDMLRELGEL